MSGIENKENDINRSFVEFKVRYTTGVHTTGRKKGQDKIEEDIFIIIVPLTDKVEVQDYIRAYCKKQNMLLRNLDILNIYLLPGKRQFEFDCKNCGEHTINMDPTNNGFCSNYCREKFKLNFKE